MNEETLFLEWSEAVAELGVGGFGSKGHSVVDQFRGEIFDWWIKKFQEREKELWEKMEEIRTGHELSFLSEEDSREENGYNIGITDCQSPPNITH